MKVSFSKKRTTFDKISKDLDEGYTVANVFDVVMSEKLIKQSRYDWCWLSWKDVPTATGWYRINRDKVALEKIDVEQATALEWHERLFVYASGHAAVNEKLPLALYIGDEYSDSRLSGLYLCGPDVLARVAQKEV